MFEDFFDALYWATTTLTTVGYGDIYPATDLGRIISMFSAVFGVAVIALPSGVITASYLEELREEKKGGK
jgi:voltage-gated potassium channel